MLENVNVLVVNESDNVFHDVKNENDGEMENVAVNGYHHDHGNETSTRGARQDGQANVSLLCAEYQEETGSAAESDDARETHRV